MATVTRIVACLAAAGVTTGLIAGVPAHAEPRRSPVDALAPLLGPLIGPLIGPAPEPAPEPSPPRTRDSYGNTDAPDGVLRRGCRNYRYSYTVTAPTGEWTLETFLRDPTGDSIASGAFISDADPSTAGARFRFCRSGTRPGRFTIRAKLIWFDHEGEHPVWLEPSRFRLTRKR
ncbi:hypothetical protein [Nocardioides sp. YIM 152315]|uniref:hypothetical protein n=1 Tax=Nocardioides sp. YIM 152315 TaxID=3031760 RepID=UPI0023DB6C9C|nr:hypothetical protein [Nocardioides sp. YIM 152315]MDF1604156.1 hypothetical protein [Nocardioides sp. YIM 152315]